MVASGLFGDGAAAVVAVGAEHPAAARGPRVVDTASHLYPDTERAMGWDVGSTGLKIVLGAEVPDLVEQYLADDVDAAARTRTAWRSRTSPAGSAIPAARRSSRRSSRRSAWTTDDLAMTWHSLNTIGNLSSASVLHVFARHAARSGRRARATGASLMAMGPGLLRRAGAAAVVSEAWYTVLVAPRSPLERLAELVVAKRNLAWSLPRGGRETGFGHYPFMVVLHTGLLAGCLLEVWLGHRAVLPALGWPMLVLVLASQALRWWCIRTLGPQWNTRIVVVPGPAARHRRPVPASSAPELRRRRRRGVRAAARARRLDHRRRVHRAERRPADRAHPRRERRARTSGRRCLTTVRRPRRRRRSGRAGRRAGRGARRPGRRWSSRSAPASIDKACGEGLMPGALRALHTLGVDPPGHDDPRHHLPPGRPVASRGFRRRPGPRRATHRAARRAARGGRASGVADPRGAVDRCRAARRPRRGGGHARPLPRRRRRPALADPGAVGLAARAAGAAPRWGLRRHFALAPVYRHASRSPGPRDSEAYVTPVAAGPGRRRDPVRRTRAGSTSSSARSPSWPRGSRDAPPASDVRGAGPLRQRSRRPGRRTRAARRRRRRLRRRADRRGARRCRSPPRPSWSPAWSRDRPERLRAGLGRGVSRRSRWLTSGLLWAREQPAARAARRAARRACAAAVRRGRRPARRGERRADVGR